MMTNNLGLSLYISTFALQKQMFEKMKGSGYTVFTSFHIQEEFTNFSDYQVQAKTICHWLKANGFKIIADVSPKTLQYFNLRSILEFAKTMKIDILRLDYGFTDKEVLEIARNYPLCFNASTVQIDLARRLKKVGTEVYALHNFYPRPETGLDQELFKAINNNLKQLGIKVLAFIPGDEQKRGPLNLGLPTLEHHRNLPPYIAYLDLIINYQIDGIFVGDSILSEKQSGLITAYIETGIIKLPVNFITDFQDLYDKIYTIRIDSPSSNLRLQESREAIIRATIEPENMIERKRGSITIDNIGYQRYMGEIQIIRSNLPRDEKVNVIGQVNEQYIEILDCIKNGAKIQFIK